MTTMFLAIRGVPGSHGHDGVHPLAWHSVHALRLAGGEDSVGGVPAKDDEEDVIAVRDDDHPGPPGIRDDALAV